jgi:hypothetical protein
MVRRKRKSKAPHSDLGTPEAKQHGVFVLEETMVAGVKRARNTTVDPIETLRRRELIDAAQYAAGQRFAEMFRKAMLAEVYATVRFGHIPSAPDVEMLESVQRAKAEVRQAMRHLGYPLADLAEHCLGNSNPISTWRNGKSSIETLRLVLDGLKNYYKM